MWNAPPGGSRAFLGGNFEKPPAFVEFKPNEVIRVTRNADYWKPHLDGIEYTIIANLATRILGFVSGKFDTVAGVTVPLLKDVKSQAPQAVCEVVPTNVPRTLLVNPAAPPFDNRDLRRAMALSLDRNAFIDIITEGLGDIGGVMLPAPEGCGACRRICSKPCPATIPMWPRTAPKPARPWKGSATVPTSGSR
jgi:ABC-type transport system substrate-binding protein